MPMVSSYLLFAVLSIALSGFSLGYHMSVISGTLFFITKEFHLTLLEQGLAVSSILFGGMGGALVGGFSADILGRKKSLIFTIFLIFLALFYLLDAKTFSGLLLGRIVIGIAVGLASVVAPLYIAEISPPERRGSLVSCQQLFITAGVLAGYLVVYCGMDGMDWRALFAVGAIPAVIQLICLFFVPETPAWFMRQGRSRDARRNADRLHIVVGPCGKEASKGSFLQLFDTSIFLPFLIGIGISVFVQITGINTVILYAPHIFQAAGFSSHGDAILASVWVGLINMVFTVSGLWLVDRVGRRVLVLASLGGMAFFLFLLGASLSPSLLHSGLLSVISLLAYVSCFAAGLGIISWVIVSEIYPLSVRGRAMGISIFANWSSTILVSLTFLPMLQAFGIAQTYYLYGLVCLLGFWFVWAKVPETKGKTFEEIQKFWQK